MGWEKIRQGVREVEMGGIGLWAEGGGGEGSMVRTVGGGGEGRAGGDWGGNIYFARAFLVLSRVVLGYTFLLSRLVSVLGGLSVLCVRGTKSNIGMQVSSINVLELCQVAVLFCLYIFHRSTA